MLLILNQGIPKNPHQRGNAMFHVAPTTKTILHKQIHFVKEEILEGKVPKCIRLVCRYFKKSNGLSLEFPALTSK